MSVRVQPGPPGTPGVFGTVPEHPPRHPQPAFVTMHVAPSVVQTPRLSWTDPAAEKKDDEDAVIQPDIKVMRMSAALEDLRPDSRVMRALIYTFTLGVDMFKLSMASMLSVFVPQLCPGNESKAGGPDNCTTIDVPHDCSFEENFRCLTQFNNFVLVWNFICLTAMILHYSLIWRRENFMALHFKEVLEFDRLAIRETLLQYPTLQIKLHKYNKVVFRVSVAVIILQAVNLVASGYLTMGIYYNGYKTFTTFFTNLLLISLLMYACINAAHIGLKHKLAYSCVGFEPVSYNSLQRHNIKGA